MHYDISLIKWYCNEYRTTLLHWDLLINLKNNVTQKEATCRNKHFYILLWTHKIHMSIKIVIKKNTHQLQDRGYFCSRRGGNEKREKYKRDWDCLWNILFLKKMIKAKMAKCWLCWIWMVGTQVFALLFPFFPVI